MVIYCVFSKTVSLFCFFTKHDIFSYSSHPYNIIQLIKIKHCLNTRNNNNSSYCYKIVIIVAGGILHYQILLSLKTRFNTWVCFIISRMTYKLINKTQSSLQSFIDSEFLYFALIIIRNFHYRLYDMWCK